MNMLYNLHNLYQDNILINSIRLVNADQFCFFSLQCLAIVPPLQVFQLTNHIEDTI